MTNEQAIKVLNNMLRIYDEYSHMPFRPEEIEAINMSIESLHQEDDRK